MRPIIATLAAAAFAALFLQASCATSESLGDRAPSGRVFATPDASSPILNFAWISPQLARGAQPNDEGFAWLKAKGFRTVVNFRKFHSDKDKAERAGVDSVEFPVQADVFGSEPPTEEQIRGFLEVVLDPKRQPVYFHCAHGKDRTGTMAAVYRMEVDGWAADDAIAEMRRFGYHEIYKDLMEFIRGYVPRRAPKPESPKAR